MSCQYNRFLPVKKYLPFIAPALAANSWVLKCKQIYSFDFQRKKTNLAFTISIAFVIRLKLVSRGLRKWVIDDRVSKWVRAQHMHIA